MGRILSLPFGLNSLTAGIEIDAITGGTTLSLTSAPISLKYLSGGNDSNNYVDRIIPTTVSGRTYYCRFNFKYHTLPTNTDGKVFIAVLRDTGWYGVAIGLTTAGTLKLFESNTNAQIGTGTSPTLSVDTWYLVELSYTHSNYTGTARLNGSQFATGDNGIGTADISLLSFGNITLTANTTAGEWYFKDVVINDDQGSYQNTWPGNGNLIMLRPSAPGDSAGWTRAGTDTGANWSQCNDTPPSDASYIQATTANALDMYNCTDSGIAAGAVVNVVEVGGRFKRSASVSPGFKFRIIKTGSGTEALSAEITPTDSSNWRTNSLADPKTSPVILYKDPDGSLAWTQTTIDSMQIGVVETTDTNRLIQVSEVWAIVDYTSITSLTVANGSHTQAIESPALTQQHNIVPANGSHAQALESPVLVCIIDLIVADMGHSHVLETADLVQKIPLAVADASHIQAIETPALTQLHEIVTQDCGNLQELESIVLTQLHILEHQNSTHVQEIETPELGQLHELNSQDLSHIQSLEALLLNQNNYLSVNDISASQTLEGAELTQLHILTNNNIGHTNIITEPVLDESSSTVDLIPSDIEHIQSSETINLVEINLLGYWPTRYFSKYWPIDFWPDIRSENTLVISNCSHNHNIENTVLTQLHELVANDLSLAQNIESFALTQQHILDTQNLDHVQTLETISISQAQNLFIGDLAHIQTLEDFALSQKHELTMQDATQNQTIDQANLTQLHILTKQDLDHSQTLENVSVNTSMNLAVDDSSHAQTIEAVALSQRHILATADAYHEQVIGTPTLIQKHYLAAQDAAHTQIVGNVDLNQFVGLSVTDLAHTQAMTEATLTQVHNLSLQNAFQNHDLDAVIILQGAVLAVADIYCSQTLSVPPLGYEPDLDRILYKEDEDRTLFKSAENRTLTVPQDDRTLERAA